MPGFSTRSNLHTRTSAFVDWIATDPATEDRIRDQADEIRSRGSNPQPWQQLPPDHSVERCIYNASGILAIPDASGNTADCTFDYYVDADGRSTLNSAPPASATIKPPGVDTYNLPLS